MSIPSHIYIYIILYFILIQWCIIFFFFSSSFNYLAYLFTSQLVHMSLISWYNKHISIQIATLIAMQNRSNWFCNLLAQLHTSNMLYMKIYLKKLLAELQVLNTKHSNSYWMNYRYQILSNLTTYDLFCLTI